MADMSEIAVAMKRLTDAMPPPRGVEPSKAFAAYCKALLKFSVDEIDAGIDRFLAGECDPKISLKFYPRPPELARIVGGVKAERAAEAEKARRAELLVAERREMAEAEVARKKTPEQIARAEELLRKYRAGEHIETATSPMRNPRAGFRPEAPRQKDDVRDPLFVANTRDPWAARGAPAVRSEEYEAPADDVRERNGMTEEALAGIRDRPLPKGMKQVGDAAPAIPVPVSERDDPPFGGF